MTSYKCNKCKREFSRKSSYDNHMKRKTPCSAKHKSKCKYCGKQFTGATSVYNHLKRGACKNYDTDTKSEIKKSVKVVGKLKKEINENLQGMIKDIDNDLVDTRKILKIIKILKLTIS